MIGFLKENLGTIVVGAILAAVLIMAAFKIRKDKKSGKGCCGNCSSCGCDCKMQYEERGTAPDGSENI
ncbi:MAG: FeoB-associated Cys-rich membrane protein [Clostridia bacterium]|nr:FeoB-associated Cys-rich membrane protein [Clostridia bacterium]